MTLNNPNQLCWYDLTVKVKAKKSLFHSTNGPFKETKPILDGVSGDIKSGELVAVIGSSGAGKTTLLEVLSGTLQKGFSVSGKIKVNGQDGKRIVRNNCSFLKQFKTLIPQLTVKEYLWYQFSLRVSKLDMDQNSVMNIIEKLIQDVGLAVVQNTVIGETSLHKALSGGEMRRIAFASEILGDPKFLFLDEPTTGLDSFAAKECVAILKRTIVSRGICGLCTIHQPSSSILSYFDRIIIMTPLGKQAYQGKVASALEFFKEQLGLACPIEYNPCDFFIKHVSISGKDEMARTESLSKIKNICQKYQSTVDILEAEELATSNENDGSFLPVGEAGTKNYATSTSTQIKVLLWKESLWFYRFPNRIWVKSNRSLGLAIFFSCLFWKQSLTNVGAHNLTAVICQLTTWYGMHHYFNGAYGLNAVEFVNDYKDRLYSIHSYLISKTILDMVYCILDTIILSTVVYWSIGLDATVIKWAVYVGLMTLSNLSASTAGEVLLLVSPRISYFYELSSCYSRLTMISSGYFIRFSSIPNYISWLVYLCYSYYSAESMMINQWNDIKTLDCEENFQSLCYESGKDVLRDFSFKTEHYYVDVLYQAALTISLKILVYVWLLIKVKF